MGREANSRLVQVDYSFRNRTCLQRRGKEPKAEEKGARLAPRFLRIQRKDDGDDDAGRAGAVARRGSKGELLTG